MIPWYLVGGAAAVSNLNISFQDGAGSTFGLGDTPASQTYAPSHQVNPMWNPFTAPAPSTPNGLAFSVFNGDDPNGTWNLWIEDSFSGSANVLGSIDSWALAIWTNAALSEPINWLASRQLALDTDFTTDPDGNGTSLLEEYAFAMSTTDQEPDIGGEADASDVSIEFDRRMGSAHGLTYTIRENLLTPDPSDGGWSTAAVTSLTVLQDYGDGTERVKATVASGSGARKFLHVKASMP